MMKIEVCGASAACAQPVLLTTGMVGRKVSFSFDEAWIGLGKCAVFTDGTVARDMVLQDGQCDIPHEVLQEEGAVLRVGVYGINDAGDIVIPTVYADCGVIRCGTDPSGDESYPPTPEIGEQAVAMAEEAFQAARKLEGHMSAAEQYAKEAGDSAFSAANSAQQAIGAANNAIFAADNAARAVLQEAKESGEFSVSVAFVAESGELGGSNVVTFSDGKKLTVKNGSKGDPGYTPRKGIDYWTGDEKEEVTEQITRDVVTEEMIQQVMAALATPVFGRVDANNNIILVGNLANGSYTLKYENVDGSETVIGAVVITPDAPAGTAIPLNLQLGKIDRATGEITASKEYLYSDMIPFESGKAYTLTITDAASSVRVCYYDADGNFMSCTEEDVVMAVIEGPSGWDKIASDSADIPVLSGAAYFRCRYYCNWLSADDYSDTVQLAITNSVLTVRESWQGGEANGTV